MGPAVERGERERRRENATKGLMKREDGEEEASIKQNGAGVARARRRGQTERIDDRTNKDRGIGRGRDGCHREWSKCHAARSECVA